MSSMAKSMAAAAERVADMVRKAAQANAGDRFLRGSVVELPGLGELMVTGDIHGNKNNLGEIVRIANLQRHRGRHLVLQEVVHSLDEREDGRCLSYQLVEMVARLKVTFPDRVHVLLGNHEMAEAMDLPIGKRGRNLNEAFDSGGRTAYGDRWPQVKAAYQEFWRTMPLAVRTENRLFLSHSTPRGRHVEEITLSYLRGRPVGSELSKLSPVYYFLWGRDYSKSSAKHFARQVDGEVLLVGHTACDDGHQVPNHRHVIMDSKDYNGVYAILPLGEPLTQEQVVRRIRKIYG